MKKATEKKKLSNQTKTTIEFTSWMQIVEREKRHYPLFKGESLNEKHLRILYDQGKTPIEALNDLSTAA